MKAKKAGRKIIKTMPPIRASVSFPRDVYETLGVIAKEKKVSVAWVVREAADNYISDRWPLLGRATR